MLVINQSGWWSYGELGRQTEGGVGGGDKKAGSKTDDITHAMINAQRK